MNTTDVLNTELNISEHLKDNLFLNQFCEHFTEGELKIPCFPDVALKLRKALQQDCEIADVVKIVNMDPVISAKLIQVVNSPLYRAQNPISNCFNAINRLGRKTTCNMVIAFSMKNLIQSKNPLIKKLIHYNWLQSIMVSSISYTLARLLKKTDPDDALLAGLLHNIGALPLLAFADNLPEGTYQAADVDLLLNEIHGQIGSISGQVGAVILEKWDFPDNLKVIPLQSINWFTNTSEAFTLNDIILLAKYHHFLAAPGHINWFTNTSEASILNDTGLLAKNPHFVASNGHIELPLITAMPAFQKLHNQPLTSEMSLQILYDAKQQIAETMSFFSQ